MTDEQRAAKYIGKCVIDGAEEIKRMLGLDKPVRVLEQRTGGAALAQVIRLDTTPRRLLNV